MRAITIAAGILIAVSLTSCAEEFCLCRNEKPQTVRTKKVKPDRTLQLAEPKQEQAP